MVSSSYHRRYTAVLMVPCHRWRRWRPCSARALCPLKPWWAALGSRYPSTIHTNYPDTSVSDAPLLSPSIFQTPPSFQDHTFSWPDSGKQLSCRWQILITRVRRTPASPYRFSHTLLPCEMLLFNNDTDRLHGKSWFEVFKDAFYDWSTPLVKTPLFNTALNDVVFIWLGDKKATLKIHRTTNCLVQRKKNATSMPNTIRCKRKLRELFHNCM